MLVRKYYAKNIMRILKNILKILNKNCLRFLLVFFINNMTPSWRTFLPPSVSPSFNFGDSFSPLKHLY